MPANMLRIVLFPDPEGPNRTVSLPIHRIGRLEVEIRLPPKMKGLLEIVFQHGFYVSPSIKILSWNGAVPFSGRATMRAGVRAPVTRRFMGREKTGEIMFDFSVMRCIYIRYIYRNGIYVGRAKKPAEH